MKGVNQTWLTDNLGKSFYTICIRKQPILKV